MAKLDLELFQLLLVVLALHLLGGVVLCHVDPFVAQGPNVAERRSISPGNRDADVAWYAAGKIDDLIGDAIAARLQVVGPELEDFFRNAGQGVLPALLHLIDSAALVRAQRIREPVDQYFRHSVSYCPLDDG